MIPCSNENLKSNLLTIYSLPIQFSEKAGDRCLKSLSKATFENYQRIYITCSTQAVKLLVAYKKSDAPEVYQDWNCSVVSFDELSSILNSLLDLNLAEGKTHRHQIMVSSLGHFSNLDIEVISTSEGNKMNIAVLDASGGSLTYLYALLPALKELKAKHSFIENFFYTEGCIQEDKLTCGVFAFNIAKQLKKLPDFHSFLKKNAAPDGKISWRLLPASLLKQAQPQTFISDSSQMSEQFCNQKSESLRTYFVKHKGFIDVKPDIQRNLASTDQYLKYAERLRPIIESLSCAELNEVIDGKKPLKPFKI